MNDEGQKSTRAAAVAAAAASNIHCNLTKSGGGFFLLFFLFFIYCAFITAAVGVPGLGNLNNEGNEGNRDTAPVSDGMSKFYFSFYIFIL